MNENAIRITLLFPCFNEEKNIPFLYKRLMEIVGNDPTYELLFVDDGSTDGTLRLLHELADRDRRLKYM